MAAASNQNRLFVLVPEADELVVVGTDSMETVARLSVDDQPVDLDLDHRGNRLAVACAGSGHVLVYDASSLELLDRIPVGQRPRAVAFDERSERLFVATEGPASVVAVELETGQATSFGRLPSAAADLELDPDGRLLWAACPRAGLLVGFDLFTLRTQVSVEVPGAPDRLLAPGRIRR
jgi:DNA-binding beta-propeller fold protein YncE